MATILEQIKRLERLNEAEITKQLFLAVKKAEDKFIAFNKLQLSEGKNALGVEVGKYKVRTQTIADLFEPKPIKPKEAGSPYNFQWSGDFFDGFKLGINGDEATILSNALGSDDKLHFLTSNNLFGLNDENLAKVIKEEILPFINNFARRTLKI